MTFNDITPLLADGPSFRAAIDWLTTEARALGTETVLGTDALGFIVGSALAHALGVGFIPVRKPGKLPAPRLSEPYDPPETKRAHDTGAPPVLEVHRDSIEPGTRILIVDDVLGGGGTSLAVARLASALKGRVTGFAFLLELRHLGGRKRLADHQVRTVVSYSL